jgi:hypothetical protein
LPFPAGRIECSFHDVFIPAALEHLSDIGHINVIAWFLFSLFAFGFVAPYQIDGITVG